MLTIASAKGNMCELWRCDNIADRGPALHWRFRTTRDLDEATTVDSDPALFKPDSGGARRPTHTHNELVDLELLAARFGFIFELKRRPDLVDGPNMDRGDAFDPALFETTNDYLGDVTVTSIQDLWQRLEHGHG